MQTLSSFVSPRLRTVLVTLSALLAMSCASAPPGEPEERTLPPAGAYSIDTPHTFVQFRAQHQVVGRVDGRFDRTTGTIIIDEDLENCRLDISIDAASISTHNNSRDEDLRGADFFDADNYPTIEYHGRGVRKHDKGWIIDGELTIRDVKQVVPLSITFRGIAPLQEGKPSRVGFHGTAAVQRANFKMTRDLLKEIGAVSESPDVWIDIDAELLSLD